MKKSGNISYLFFIIIFLFSSCNTDILEGLRDSSRLSTEGIPLTVQGVISTSITNVRVTFSEDVEETTSETTGNYSIPGLTVSSAVRDSIDYGIVNITTSSQEEMSYTLTISNVENMAGNPIGDPNSGAFKGFDGIVPSEETIDKI